MTLDEFLSRQQEKIKKAENSCIKEAQKLIEEIVSGKSTGDKVVDHIISTYKNLTHYEGVVMLNEEINSIKKIRNEVEAYRGQYIVAKYEEFYRNEELDFDVHLIATEWGKVAETGDVLLVDSNEMVRINTNEKYNFSEFDFTGFRMHQITDNIKYKLGRKYFFGEEAEQKIKETRKV